MSRVRRARSRSKRSRRRLTSAPCRASTLVAPACRRRRPARSVRTIAPLRPIVAALPVPLGILDARPATGFDPDAARAPRDALGVAAGPDRAIDRRAHRAVAASSSARTPPGRPDRRVSALRRLRPRPMIHRDAAFGVRTCARHAQLGRSPPSPRLARLRPPCRCHVRTSRRRASCRAIVASSSACSSRSREPPPRARRPTAPPELFRDTGRPRSASSRSARAPTRATRRASRDGRRRSASRVRSTDERRRAAAASTARSARVSARERRPRDSSARSRSHRAACREPGNGARQSRVDPRPPRSRYRSRSSGRSPCRGTRGDRTRARCARPARSPCSR